MDLSRELRIFSSFADRESEFCRISSVGSSILFLENKSAKKPSSSQITLGFLALVHGNEYLGLPILNSLLQSILDGKIEFQSNVYFGLGNLPAALANQRYLEEDLNRCFGKKDTQTKESQRARELEKLMLDHCDFLVDIHQTVAPAQDPFFIFQYSNERCLAVMEKWNPGIPTILQQDPIGENTGLSTDEYLRSHGKFGTALELGQLGTSDHSNLGLDICKNILQVTNDELAKPQAPSPTLRFPVLQFKGSYKVKNDSYKLDQGWKNLKSFSEGEALGVCSEGIVLAPHSGFMLFPRYRPLSEGQELFYYCTPIKP